LEASEVLAVGVVKSNKFVVVLETSVDRLRSLVIIKFHGLNSAKEVFNSDLLKESADTVHGKSGTGSIVAAEDGSGVSKTALIEDTIVELLEIFSVVGEGDGEKAEKGKEDSGSFHGKGD